MKIVVVGGSGLIGSRLVAMLLRDGHDVVAASRRSGVDVVSGEGLAAALKGASVVVDVTNAPSFEDTAVMKFFKTSTHNLLTAEAAAGVTHHVALSVVGAERLLHSGYLRAKFAQEKLIKESSIPHSIVQATQFFEFLHGIADAATHGTAVRLPPVLIQPIAADDVARAVAGIATSAPLNGAREIGGPEPFYLDGLVQRVLGAHNDVREVIGDPHARYFGTELGERPLLPATKHTSVRSGSTSGSFTPHGISILGSNLGARQTTSARRSRRTSFASAKCLRDPSCCWAMSQCSTSRAGSARRRPGVRTGKVR
jgi:uncharacterized protein YbjT (DUF2867 family)